MAEESEVTITSVHWNGKVMRVSYERDHDSYSAVYHDKPKQSFLDAMKEMAPHVGMICECDFEAGVEVRGIQITDSKKDARGLVVKAIKRLEENNRPLVINTPVTYEDMGDGETEHGTHDDDCSEIVDRILDEAKLYVRGERDYDPESGDLFEGQTDDDEGEEDADDEA